MRKIFFISGALMVILLVLFFTGVVDFGQGNINTLVKGNKLYADGKYKEALETYQKGIDKRPRDIKLNYNSGQSAYRLEDYEKAIEYYDKGPEKVDRYLNSGNCSLKLGDKESDDSKKLEYYKKALETYKQGILKYPENINLKYNYEYVKNKIDELQKNNPDNEQDQQNQNNQDDNQNQDDEKDGQNQDGQKDNEHGQENNEDQQDQQGEKHREAMRKTYSRKAPQARMVWSSPSRPHRAPHREEINRLILLLAKGIKQEIKMKTVRLHRCSRCLKNRKKTA
jgi:Ca-activated chloride channel family protein